MHLCSMKFWRKNSFLGKTGKDWFMTFHNINEIIRAIKNMLKNYQKLFDSDEFSIGGTDFSS